MPRQVQRRPFVLGSLAVGSRALTGCAGPLPTPLARAPARPRGELDLRDFGAVPDGASDASAAFGAALDEIKRRGGGTLRVTGGTFLTGPLHLTSNLVLRVDAGATLLFSDKFDDYLPMVRSRWEGTMVKTFCSITRPTKRARPSSSSIARRRSFMGVSQPAPTSTFLSVGGASSDAILLGPSHLGLAKTRLRLDPAVPPGAVIERWNASNDVKSPTR